MEIQFIRAHKFSIIICLPEKYKHFKEGTQFSMRSYSVNLNDLQKLSSYHKRAKSASVKGSKEWRRPGEKGKSWLTWVSA